MAKFTKKTADNTAAIRKPERTVSLSRKKPSASVVAELANNKEQAQVAAVETQKKLVNLAANGEQNVNNAINKQAPAAQESYNELFLNLAERYNLQKSLMNGASNGGKITALNLKKKDRTTILSPRQMAKAYFQSSAYQNNPSRENNPLRAQRMNLLKDEDFLEKHGKLSQFLIVKNMNNLQDKVESMRF